MAISKAEKAAYNDEVKDLKRDVDFLKKAVNEALGKKKKHPNIANYYNLEMASRGMDAIDCYLKMNDLSVEMLGLRSSNLLENARKEFYKVLQSLEELVGKDIDRSLKENDTYLATINRINPRHVLALVQRIHRILNNMKNKFGQDTKWKWSFVELHARVAVITKNITSFSELARFRDPRNEFFQERREMMQMCKESLTEAAKQYRTKYEVAGRARDDLTKSIEYLSALRKIHQLFGEDQEVTKLKNIIDAAKQTLEESDKLKEKDKEKKEKEGRK
jgi:uncharacterized membrane protein YgaE (UPF0421/DUF939 family)